jgi:hypothetical protein
MLFIRELAFAISKGIQESLGVISTDCRENVIRINDREGWENDRQIIRNSIDRSLEPEGDPFELDGLHLIEIVHRCVLIPDSWLRNVIRWASRCDSRVTVCIDYLSDATTIGVSGDCHDVL